MIHSKWSSNQSSVDHSMILSSFQMIVIQNNSVRKHFYKNERKKISNCSFNREVIYSWILEDFKTSNFAVCLLTATARLRMVNVSFSVPTDSEGSKMAPLSLSLLMWNCILSIIPTIIMPSLGLYLFCVFPQSLCKLL